MTNLKPRILVTGSGVTGGEVLRQLAASRQKAVALVRNPTRAETFRSLGIELIEGDFAQKRDWRRALDGVDRVFIITTAHHDAVVWHAQFLDILFCSQTHFTKICWARPNQSASMDGFGRPVGDARISMIDVRDVAAVAVKTLIGEGHVGKVYVLTGPQALTYTDVASFLSEVLRKPIRYEALDPEGAIRELVALGVPEKLARDRVGIQCSFSGGAFTQITDEVSKLLRRTPRPFMEFARDHANAFC